MLWVLVSSFKTSQEIFFSPWLPPAILQWDNFARAWSEASIGLYFFNTLAVIGPAIFITLLLSAMAGYVLARFTFPGSRAIFFSSRVVCSFRWSWRWCRSSFCSSRSAFDTRVGCSCLRRLFAAFHDLLPDRLLQDIALRADRGGRDRWREPVRALLPDRHPAGEERPGQHGDLQLPGAMEPVHPAAWSCSPPAPSTCCPRAWPSCSTSSGTRATGAAFRRRHDGDAPDADRLRHLPEPDPARP